MSARSRCFDMGFFGLFSPAKKTDAAFGEVVYRRGAWNGDVSIAGLHDERIALEIETAKDSDLSKFQSILNCVRKNVETIKDQIAQEAFSTYRRYIEEDRKAGNFTNADYSIYPAVTSVADIWRVLSPFRLTMTDAVADYNAMLWLDVDWPNPHYFVACLDGARLYQLEVEG
ncbi:MAG TPA: hypothetical protein VHB99_07175 [Pirellulales bacterium]|nr:hypothetical protein [Pirellulales bacterium]